MAKTIAMVFGWILLIIGLLGFVSNPIVGSGDALFMADGLHNIVHLLTGAIFLWVAKKGGAQKMLKVFGFIYLIVALAGFVSGTSVLGIMASNVADNWLHLVFAAVFLWAGYKKEGAAPMMNQQQM